MGERQGKQTSSMYVEQAAPEDFENGIVSDIPEDFENGIVSNIFDDDGRPKRTGTFLTASAHIITAVIGSGVLSLAWAMAQLGWVTGSISLLVFSLITYFTSTLLADSYRAPGPVTGTRNYTYMDVVRAHLGGYKVTLCGIAQYVILVGITIGYTITSAISMVAVKKSNCFHKHGHYAKCSVPKYPFMIIFAAIQVLLSQVPNFHKLSLISIVAAVMSFAYSSIGLGLAIAKFAGGTHAATSLTGVPVGVGGLTGIEKVWRSFQALGNIAFAYSYSNVLVEIQDTLRSHPPENKVMKRASLMGVSTTTIFYTLCGCFGYAAFGNDAPGNFLTGFGFYEPYWLIDFANICIVVHLIGAYQVFSQPIFNFVEGRTHKHWPEHAFLTTEHPIRIPRFGAYHVNFFRIIWRTAYVIVTAVIATIFPFFNDFLGLIGACSFYPLTVYFPIEMHIAQRNIPKYSIKWISLKVLSYVCLVVSLVAAAGSIQGLAKSIKIFKPFQSQD